MTALGVRERDQLDEPARLGGVVVGDRCFEMLTLRYRLTELPSQPAQEAYGGLVGHACRLTGDGAPDSASSTVMRTRSRAPGP
jgi:hypothetical protein